ncbi:PF10617 family protein [Bordetella bronchiseptica GA96-01]|nr:DUF2474 family protein [Bordetella bronchiseptica]AZW29877.1 DUF2474 domain-containing protein [Bordetella bronchiseptica]KCV44407.1 PF10617 family protein [Bordetella bronchiseptica 345]KDC37870.1 PF10617 family protein [Bordetella bronchiseptica GA96-01]KDD11333.1 PF10617 family protein [Bordetella bronchiseptica MBORD707]
MTEDTLDRPASTLHRLGWLALLWAGGVAGLGLAAGGLKLIMKLAGLTP